MLERTRNAVGAAVIAAAVVVTPLAADSALAAPAAQRQSGLVNVSFGNTAVTVPINAAANICGITVQALTTALAPTGTTTCTSRSGQTATVSLVR